MRDIPPDIGGRARAFGDRGFASRTDAADYSSPVSVARRTCALLNGWQLGVLTGEVAKNPNYRVDLRGQTFQRPEREWNGRELFGGDRFCTADK
jgi:hypothetical protein